MADELVRSERGGALVTVSAGLLMALGSFLPWVTATSGFGTISRNGMEGGDGVITLMLGVVVSLIGAAKLTGADLPKIIAKSPIPAGVVVAIIAAINYADIRDRISGLDSDFGAANMGAGIWTLFIGAVLALIGGIALKGGTGSETASSATATRECPHCKEGMRRDASVCPHCQRDSKPWTLHGGYWWSKSESGEDYWYDEEAAEWNKYVPRGPEPRDVEGARDAERAEGRQVSTAPTPAKPIEPEEDERDGMQRFYNRGGP